MSDNSPSECIVILRVEMSAFRQTYHELGSPCTEDKENVSVSVVETSSSANTLTLSQLDS